MQKPSRILAAQKFLSTAGNDSRFYRNAFVNKRDLERHFRKEGSGPPDLSKTRFCFRVFFDNARNGPLLHIRGPRAHVASAHSQ